MNGKIKAIEQAKIEFDRYITADTALPQQWLLRFANENSLSYDEVRESTVWVYLKNLTGGIPHSSNSEVQRLIEEEYGMWYEDLKGN